MVLPTFKDGSIARRKRPGAALLPEDTATLVEAFGIHNSTPPTLADGDMANTQMDDLGNIKISLGDPAQLATLGGSAAAIGDGSKNVTTAGTRLQLSSSSVPCKKVIIVAKEANTGTIWVGGSAVASGRGRPLVALQSETIEINDLNKVYIDATVNGEGVTFLYVT